MAVRKIVKYGDDILKEKIEPTDFKTLAPLLPALLKDMEETCLFANGAGLAANQIGLKYRLAVILIPEEKKDGEQKYKRFVIINPEIVSSDGKILQEEGCLSFPGLFVEIERAQNIVVRYINEKGLPMQVHAKGLLAKALQHEIDHLDGKVFIDRADPALKPEIKKELKKLSKNWD